MSMSLIVEGFRSPNDPTLKKMMAVLKSLEAIEIDYDDYPPDVVEYFSTHPYGGIGELGGRPDEEIIDGMTTVDLDKILVEWRDDTGEGFELDVASIPAGVRKIRFRASW